MVDSTQIRKSMIKGGATPFQGSRQKICEKYNIFKTTEMKVPTFTTGSYRSIPRCSYPSRPEIKLFAGWFRYKYLMTWFYSEVMWDHREFTEISHDITNFQLLISPQLAGNAWFGHWDALLLHGLPSRSINLWSIPWGDSRQFVRSIRYSSSFRGWFWVMSEIFSTGEDKKRSVQCRDPKKKTQLFFMDGFVQLGSTGILGSLDRKPNKPTSPMDVSRYQTPKKKTRNPHWVTEYVLPLLFYRLPGLGLYPSESTYLSSVTHHLMRGPVTGIHMYSQLPGKISQVICYIRGSWLIFQEHIGSD